jgi:UDP-N-acetylglucosamine 2-epimerase (non-hydrolysing)
MIHILIGTRAQLIKMIPIMHELQRTKVNYNFIFMAQHRETIYEMLDDFGLKKPDHVLCDEGRDIVSSKHMAIWSFKVLFKGLISKAKLFQGDKKGIVLIHGDAPPLLLGAILAKSQGLKVGSVEAGLRSFNFWKPFPEEITRVITAKTGLLDVFYCQDKISFKNSQNYSKGRCVLTHGNTIVDAISLATNVNRNNNNEVQSEKEFYAVVTLHRFETISNIKQLSKVIELVELVAQKINVKFILHPPTRAAIKKHNFYQRLELNEKIVLLPRMNFINFNALIISSEFIVTDGGSNQEESAFLGIPCLLFRNETEREDGLNSNVVLSNFNENIINNFVSNYKDYKKKVKELDISPTRIILDDIHQNYR